MAKPNGPSPSRAPEQVPMHGTPALGQTQPLVRSTSTIQPSPSTARRRAYPANSAVDENRQGPSAFEMTRIWNQKPEVEVLFDKPLTVVTNQERALFGSTQRIVPQEARPRCAPPVDDTAVTQVFRPGSASASFDGNLTVELPPGSGPRESNQTQLIRPATIIDLELPQVARCSVRDEQIIPQAARPKLGAAQAETRPVPASVVKAAPLVPSARTATAPEVASGRTQAAIGQTTGLAQSERRGLERTDTKSPATVRSARVDFGRTLVLRDATAHPRTGQAEHQPSSPMLTSFDIGVTHVLPVEALIARRNQVRNGDDKSGEAVAAKESHRLEPLLRRVAERVIGRWQKLPRLTRGAFVLALFGELLWGANAECGSRPEVPVVALVAPNRPNAAMATDPIQEPELGANAAADNAGPLPRIDSRSTLERAAVDATAEGRYDVAIRLYDALAKAHPDNPVFHEAARILAARTQQQ